MNSCNFRAANGENSLLYAALEQEVGEVQATKLWHIANSEEFQQDNPNLLQDKNGEPLAEEVLSSQLGSDPSYTFEPIPESAYETMPPDVVYPAIDKSKVKTIDDVSQLPAVKKSKSAEINVLNYERFGVAPGVQLVKNADGKNYTAWVKVGSPAYFQYLDSLDHSNVYQVKRTKYVFLTNKMRVETLEARTKRLEMEKKLAELRKEGLFLIKPTARAVSPGRTVERLNKLHELLQTKKMWQREIKYGKEQIEAHEKKMDNIGDEIQAELDNIDKKELVDSAVNVLTQGTALDAQELRDALSKLPKTVLANITFEVYESGSDVRGVYHGYEFRSNLIDDVAAEMLIGTDFLKEFDEAFQKPSTNYVLNKAVDLLPMYAQRVLKKAIKAVNEKMLNGEYKTNYSKEDMLKISSGEGHFYNPRELAKFTGYLMATKGRKTKLMALLLETEALHWPAIFKAYMDSYKVAKSELLKALQEKGDTKIAEIIDTARTINELRKNLQSGKDVKLVRKGADVFIDVNAQVNDVIHETGHHAYALAEGTKELKAVTDLIQRVTPHLGSYVDRIREAYKDANGDISEELVQKELFANIYAAILTQKGELYDKLNSIDIDGKPVEQSKSAFREFIEYIHEMIKVVFGSAADDLNQAISKLNQTLEQTVLAKAEVNGQLIEAKILNQQYEKLNRETELAKAELLEKGLIVVDPITGDIENAYVDHHGRRVPSQLFQELNEIFDKDAAAKVYLTTHTPNFKKFMQGADAAFLNDVGEPKLFAHGTSTAYHSLNTSYFMKGEGAMAHGAGLYITDFVPTALSYSTGATRRNKTEKYKELFNRLFNKRVTNKYNNPYIHELFLNLKNPIFLAGFVSQGVKDAVEKNLSEHLRLDPTLHYSDARLVWKEGTNNELDYVAIAPNAHGDVYYQALMYALAYKKGMVGYLPTDSRGIMQARFLPSIGDTRLNPLASAAFHAAGIEANYRFAGGATNAFGGQHKRGEMHVIAFDSNGIKSVNNTGAFDRTNTDKYYSKDLGEPKEDPNEVRYNMEHVLAADKKNPLTEQRIMENLSRIYDEASANPEKTFHIDLPSNMKEKIKLGDKTSISALKLAVLADHRAIPYNVKFNEGFESILQNTPRRFLSNIMYQDNHMYEPLAYDEAMFRKQLDETFVPVRSADGTKTGNYFDNERQTEVVDSIIYFLYQAMSNADKIKKNYTVDQFREMIKNDGFKSRMKNYRRVAGGEILKGYENLSKERAASLASEFELVLNSFDAKDGLNFWTLAIQRLKDLGINIRENTFKGDNPDEVKRELSEGTFEEGKGEGLTDWSDSHFKHDPKDTATGRLKMYLATVVDSTVGEEERPREVSFSFRDNATREMIAKGQKQFTIRTAEQAKALRLTQPGSTALFSMTLDSGGEKLYYRVTALRPATQTDVELHGERIKKEEGVDMKIGDMLYRIESFTPAQNVIKPNRSYLGLPKLADFEQLFNDMLGKLAGQERSFDNYIRILTEEGNKFNPNLRALAEKLKTAPPDVQNEFVSVVTLQYQPFTMMLLDTRKDSNEQPYYVLRPIEANRGSQLNVIKETWQQNQKFSPILKRNAASITVVDPEKAKELQDDLDRVNQAFITGDKNAMKAAKDLFRKVLDYNGITMTDEAIKAFTDQTTKWTRKTSVAGDFRRQFAVSEKGEPMGIVSSMIMKLNGVQSVNDVVDTTEDRSYMMNNPLYTEGTALTILSRVAAAYTPTLYSNTHRSSEGKTIYDYGANSTLSNNMRRLKNDEAFRARFDDVDIAKNSFVLTRINNNADLREKMSLAYLDGLKAVYMPGASGIVRPQMSDREQVLTALGLFQNRGNAQYAHYISLTHSDKTTTPILQNMPRIANVTTTKVTTNQLSGTSTASPVLSDEVFTELFNVFNSEYDRMKRAKQVGSYNNPRYDAGSQYFFFLPQFNYEMAKKTMIKEQLDKLFFEDGTMKPRDTPGFRDTVKTLLQKHVNDITNNTLEEWKKNDIINEENTPFDRRYLNRLLAGIGIRFYENLTIENEVLQNVYVGVNNRIYSTKDIARITATLAARDYAVNSFLVNVSMSQLLYGDPAQMWKGSVEKTMVEYGKRLAKDIAPGHEGNWKPGETYIAVTAKDFKANAKYLQEFEELRDSYVKGEPIKASDAQELTTVQEHLDVMYAYGRISQETYKQMSDIIKKADGGYYEFTDPHHKDVVMQAMKPVYVADRVPVNGAILNDYIKTSSYPLYPPFLVSKELDKVRTAMEKGGVARINFESGKKVGLPSNSVKLFNSDGTVNEDVFKSPAWTGVDKNGVAVPSARQSLSRDGFRIQQKVPYDETKESIRTVSQMNKLIVEGIPQVRRDFQYDGREVSGKKLVSIKEEIRKQLIRMNQDKLMQEIGAKIENNHITFTDKKKLFDALRKRVLEGSAGFSANDLVYLQSVNLQPHSGEMVIPLMYAPSASKFEALLMNMVGEVANVQMPGKSYIQGSPAGHQSVGKFEDLTEEQKKQIITVEGYDGGPLKILRHENGEVKPAQVLAPFSFLYKNGEKADINKFIKVLEDGRRVIDHDKIPKELLQLIGARIPNQGHNSMLPIEIVGFVPDNMGDLIIVPAPIVNQMGSDFDVDKLYTYRRAYSFKDGKFSLSEDEELALKNKYFNVHWSVLMHPDLTTKVLKSLDKADLKEEAARIEKWEAKADNKQLNFYDPIFQLRDFQAQKDAKTLVALASLSTTFNAVIQDKNIRPGKVDISADGLVQTVIPIHVVDENNVPRKLSTLSGYGQSRYNGEVRTKNDNHTTVQSEVLDYAKNRVSDKVHLNTYTYAASAALTQLQEPDAVDEEGRLLEEGNGWAANLQWNARLLSQPIIKEYAKEMAKSGDSLSAYDPNLKKNVIAKLVEKYGGNPDANYVVSFQDLTDALSKREKFDNYNKVQAAAIRLFEQLDTIGGEMVRAQTTINHDAKGAGATMLDLISKEITKAQLEAPLGKDLALLGVSELYNGTEQGQLFNIVHSTATATVDGIFPYRKLMPLFDYIMQHTNRQDLSVEMQQRVFNAMKSYIFSHPMLGLWENPEATRATLLYKRGDKPSLAERVQQAKMTWGQNNYFLQRLQTEVDPDNLHPSSVSYLASKASNLDESENTRAWLDLLMSNDPEKKLLGEDLVRYCYITGGLQDANSFVKFIPYSFLLGTDFGIRLREITNNLKDVILTSTFKTQLFQHEPQMATSLSADFSELGGLESYPERFELPEINPELYKSEDDPNPAKNLVTMLTTADGRRIPGYPEFLSYRSTAENTWILYKQVPNSNTYIRIDTLGNKVTSEYSYNEGMTVRSLIAENRSKAYENIQPALRSLNNSMMGESATVMDTIKQQFNVPDHANARQIHDILVNIAGDDRIPNYLRVVSKFLADTDTDNLNPNMEALKSLTASGIIPQLSMQVLYGEREREILGDFGAAEISNISRVISIGGSHMKSKTHFAETLNHEIIHDRTAIIALMSETDDVLQRRGLTPAEVAFIKNEARNFFSKNPEIKKIIDELNSIREEAKAALIKEMARKGHHYETVQKQIDAKQKVSNPWGLHVYAMNSNSEFITMAMSNLEIMQFLNRHQAQFDNGNFLSKVMDVLRSLISAIGTAMGVRVERGSLLEKSLRLSLDLMTVNKVVTRSATELSDPNNMLSGLSNKAMVNPVLTATDRIIGKLTEQREQLRHSLTGRLTKEEYADKMAKIDKMQVHIDQLRASNDFVLLGEIGKEHLKWVDTILKNDNPTEAQLMTASKVLEIWGNLVSIVYDKNSTEDADPVFAQIQADAVRMRGILTGKMETLLVKESEDIVRMKDFNGQELQDMSKWQSMPRALSAAASSTVSQYIATFMETVARDRDEDIVRLVRWTEKLKKDIQAIAGKDLNGFFDKFMQRNASGTAFGLVQRYSQDWYDFRKAARVRRQAELYRIEKTLTDPREISKAKQEAWKKYWTDINEHAVFADTRLLFDTDTGDLKTDDAAQRHRAELEKEIGREAADELIDEAHRRYLQYLERKQAHNDNIDAELAAGNMTENQASIEKTAFVYKYSPNVFFNNFKSKLSEFRDLNTDYYTKMAPRRSVRDGQFYDSKFEEIQKDARLKSIYDRYKAKLAELKTMLPVHLQQEMPANFLPVVHKDLLREIMNVPAYVKTLDKQFIKKLTASEWEEDNDNKEFANIPVDYIDESKVELENRSKDLLGIMEVFGAMALHYKHFADAKDFIEMGESILKEHDRNRTAGATQQVESNGRVTTVKDGLSNTLEALNYMKEYLMYKKARKLEGKGGTVYSVLNPVKQHRIAKEVKKLLAERDRLQQEFANGDGDPSEHLEKIKAIDEKLKDPKYQGRRLYGSKVGDQIIRFNQLKTLSYNPFSAFTNVLFGMISAHIYANGKKDFTPRELIAAYKSVSHSMLKYWSHGTVESKEAQKMLAIMDRLGIIGDYVDSHYGEFKVRNRQKGWIKAISPYNLMRSGDYFMKALTTRAMLIHQKVQVTEGGVVKTISLWDALNEEGEWNDQRFGENKLWSAEDVNEQKEWSKFRNRAVRVNIIIHGNQDKNSPKLANKFIFGRLLGQFRMSWLPEGWNSRFQSERYDIQLGRDVKGRYLTYKDLGFFGSSYVLLKQLASMVSKVDPFTGARRSDGKLLSEVDIENMRRNFSELAFILGTAALILALRHLRDGDDDDKKPGLRFVINMLLRSRQDMTFYSSPQVFDNITRNVIPATQVFTDGWKAIMATARVLSDDEYEYQQWLKAVFRAGLPIPQATLYPKMDYMLNKDLADLQH